MGKDGGKATPSNFRRTFSRNQAQSSSNVVPEYSRNESQPRAVEIKGPPPPHLEEDDVDPKEVRTSGPGMTSHAVVDDTGKVDISLTLHKKLPDLPQDYSVSVKEHGVDLKGWKNCPPLNIVIFIVGSRGDVQPYVSLALKLIRSNSHRVRIATHGEFLELVREANQSLAGQRGRRGELLEGKLEFFDVGGDPKELMAYMVRNPGLLPGFKSLTNGDIPSKRKMLHEMLRGFYRSTFCPDTGSGQSFAADAIISNPPAFAHVHVAEALGLPLLMSFTMPWTPTIAFRHPLANIRETNAEPGLSNYLTYSLVDTLTWQGLGNVINKFRLKILGLDAVSSRVAPSLVDRLKIPWTYCWSESLVPKPRDWKENIDISGFYFYETNSSYTPDASLSAFLEEGPPPVYIGFGSIVIDDPKKMTSMLFEAVQNTGVRALISAGWAGLGDGDVPPGVFIIKGNIPHDWLFAEGRVTAVCHHGGAGTAAIGLRNGLPTIVVPFFGDQSFWGEMVSCRGAGPSPIPYKNVSVENLTSALEFVITPEARQAAQKMGEQIRNEDGEQRGVDSFHRHLPLLNMRCDIDPARVAIWWSEDLCLKLSGAVAGLLAAEGKLNMDHLTPHRPREYATDQHQKDPWTGTVGSLLHMLTYSIGSITEIFYRPGSGTLNTFWGIPKAGMSVVGDLYEGFDNVPSLIGSEVRQKGKVTGFGTGLKEGGKGLFWGLADGISGLIAEPIAGGQKEGPLGVLKGVGRSYVNLFVRPSAGALGVIVLPAVGISRSTAALFHKAPEGVMIGPRTDLSHSAASSLLPKEKRDILGRYEDLAPLSKTRRDRLRKKAKRWLLLPEKDREKEIVFFTDPTREDTESQTPTSASEGQSRVSQEGDDEDEGLTLNMAEQQILIERMKEASMLEAQAQEEERFAQMSGYQTPHAYDDLDSGSNKGLSSARPSPILSRAALSKDQDDDYPRGARGHSVDQTGKFADESVIEYEYAQQSEREGESDIRGKGKEKTRAMNQGRSSTAPAYYPPGGFPNAGSGVGHQQNPQYHQIERASTLPERITSGLTSMHLASAANPNSDAGPSTNAFTPVHELGYQRRKAEREAQRKSFATDPNQKQG